MPKIEPGVYEPSDDLRVFDDEDGSDEEGSRLPLLIVIALLVLAAFSGVVYLAYTQGLQRGRADAPRAVASEAGASGSETPYKNLKIYEQPAPADQDAADEDSAPPPPTETKPTPSAMQAVPAVVTHTAPPPTPSAAPPTEVAPKPLQVVAAPKPKAKPVETAPVAIAPVIPPTTEPVATAPGANSGSYVLQIGAYKSADEANTSWKSYQAKHPMLGGYESDVKKVDLGDKGTWYRLRVEGFATKDAASALCAKLKSDGGDCLLAKQ